MMTYFIGVSAAAAAGFIAGFMVATNHTRKIMLNSFAVSAYKIPVPGHCTRCRTELKTNAVMFVRKFPGPGQLLCESCFNNGMKKAMKSTSIHGTL